MLTSSVLNQDPNTRKFPKNADLNGTTQNMAKLLFFHFSSFTWQSVAWRKKKEKKGTGGGGGGGGNTRMFCVVLLNSAFF